MRRSIEALERFLLRSGAFLLFPLLMVTVLDVSFRAIFKRSLPGAIELCSFLLLVFLLSGISIAETQRDHLRVVLLRDRIKGRIGCALDLIANGWGTFVSLILAFQALKNAALDRTVSEMLRIPHKPFWFFLGLTCALLGTRFLSRIVRGSGGQHGAC